MEYFVKPVILWSSVSNSPVEKCIEVLILYKDTNLWVIFQVVVFH